MAYQSKDLSALGYANGFTLWHYKTEDQIFLVENANYFGAPAHMLRVGDFILINCRLDLNPHNAVFAVTAIEGSNVRVTKVCGA